MAFIRVGPDDIDMATEIACLQSEPGEIGGIASFLGVVRGGEGHSAITAMTLEHYPAMTEAAIRRVAEEAEARWNLIGCRVIHRVGRIPVGGRIVLVLTAARHRQAALEFDELFDRLAKGRRAFLEAGASYLGERPLG